MTDLDFSSPHPDQRIEIFAHAVACGTKQKKAFESSGLMGNLDTAPYALVRRKDVLGRVKYLNPAFSFGTRSQRGDSPKKASGKRGSIYAFTNDAMPGVFKIGFTTGDVEDRRRQLSNTSVPMDYRTYREVSVPSAAQVEKLVHTRLEQYRTQKEFFQCPATAVDEVFDDLANGIFFNAAEEVGAFARSVKGRYPHVKLKVSTTRRVVDVMTEPHPVTGESMTFPIPISVRGDMLNACSRAMAYAESVNSMVCGRL